MTYGGEEIALQEIDELEEQIGRFRAGLLSLEEFRPRRTILGVYGQRQRDRYLVRVRIPQGRLTPEQLLTLTDIAESFSPGFAHITTRQDLEYHFVLLEDVPPLLRELANVGLTTCEAGGNIVRNVTCDPLTGVCRDAVFDVTPHADALARHFVRNQVPQQLPRKTKIAFSGCPCDFALRWVHDIGAQAVRSLMDDYRPRRLPEESFRTFVRRLGAQQLRAALAPYLKPPAFVEDPEAYHDWEATNLFSLDERGEGEWAA